MSSFLPGFSGGTSLSAVCVRKLVTTPRIAAGRRKDHHWILVIRPAVAGHAGAPLNMPPAAAALFAQ
jgi:hypothetical protein